MPRSVSRTALGKGRPCWVASVWAAGRAGRLARGHLLAEGEAVALGPRRTRAHLLRKQGGFFLRPGLCAGSAGHALRPPGWQVP